MLKTVPGGAWAPVGIAPHTIGAKPRELRFSGRTISYIGGMPGPADARAEWMRGQDKAGAGGAPASGPLGTSDGRAEPE